jgi:hypothetical protein
MAKGIDKRDEMCTIMVRSGEMWQKRETVVAIDCSLNRIPNNRLFFFLKDKLPKIMGLHLEEDDHSLELKDEDKVVARWSVTGVTVEEIRDTANQYITSSCTGLELRLLRFWGRYPRAKLSLYTIAGALGAARFDLREAIAILAEKGILKEQQNANGLTTYSLSSDHQTQEYIEELGRLDWGEIKILEKQLEEAVLA